MKKTTDAFRLLGAILTAFASGVALARSMREYARDLAADKESGDDAKIRDILRTTAASSAAKGK